MRSLALPAAALLLMASVTSAGAGPGLPKVASLTAGPYTATLHNDSPTLRKGANTLTVEISSLPPDHHVTLQLRGPTGQVLHVPLRPVKVLGGVGGHGDAPGAHGAERSPHAEELDSHGKGDAKVDNHGKVDDHDRAKALPVPAAAPHSQGLAHNESRSALVAADDDHGSAKNGGTGEAFMARGGVRLPVTGTWRAELLIRDDHGDLLAGEVSVAAVDGGPNPIYLATTGSLIGGSLLFGAIQRRRRAVDASENRSITNSRNGR
jgi:hypothetical protein